MCRPERDRSKPKTTRCVALCHSFRHADPMNRCIAALAAMALPLMSCAGAHGPWGNDTGGIIPGSPEAEHNALELAQANCARHRKYAVITSVHRQYGDYIASVPMGSSARAATSCMTVTGASVVTGAQCPPTSK